MSSLTYQSRSEALAAAEQILNRKPFSKEDKARFDAMLSLANSLDSSGADELRAARVRSIGREMRTDSVETRAFMRYLAGGSTALNPEERTALEKRTTLAGAMTSAGGAYPGSAGGYFSPVEFEAAVWEMLKQYDQLFDAATIIPTKQGGPFALPLMDDTNSAAEIIAQAVQESTQNPQLLGQLSFPTCLSWRSGIILASLELQMDAGIGLDALFARSFATRFARGCGANFVSTILAAALSSGQTVIGDDSQGSPNPATQVGYADLLNLMASVDPAYVASPKCGWLLNFGTLITLANLRDKQNHPLLRLERDDSGHVLLFEKPVYICPSMPDIGHLAKPIMFGDLSRVVVRRVENSLMVRRLNETWAEYLVVGFQAFWRMQAGLAVPAPAGSPLVSSDSPVKYLQNA